MDGQARLRVGVLLSGIGGGIFNALLEATLLPGFPAELVVVVSNIPDVQPLARTRAAGIPAVTVDHRAFTQRVRFDQRLVTILQEHRVDLVCLVAFNRLVGKPLLQAFPDRVINLHPSLLPAFPGLHAVRDALAYGVAVAGCTAHFVDEGTDTGPVIAQRPVTVFPTDTEATLTSRILRDLQRLLPLVVRWFAEGRIRREGRRVFVRA